MSDSVGAGGITGGVLGLVVAVATWRGRITGIETEQRVQRAAIVLLQRDSRDTRRDLGMLLDRAGIPRAVESSPPAEPTP